jgi:hypothetical protein
MALLVFGGLSAWALALLPLLTVSPRQWGAPDLFLVLMVICPILPFLVLAPLGGGVASRYLLSCLPGMFILAGQHWERIHRHLPSAGYRLGLAAGLLAVYLPSFLSILNDGNHYDYRVAARALDDLGLEDPIIVASSHEMLRHYMRRPAPVYELTTFEGGIPRKRLELFIEQAQQKQRPLIVVSREDRFHLSPDDQRWLGHRFAAIRVIESKRFDHRRHRMVIYEYRPAPPSRETPRLLSASPTPSAEPQ